MKELQPRINKDFDLPRQHLPGRNHYVPPRARSQEEKDRRHGMPRGVLLAEFELKGLRMAAAILHQIEEPSEVRFSTQLIAPSALNSAWYGFARNADVMRRRLKLPLLAAGDIASTPDSDLLLHAAVGNLDAAAGASNLVIGALKDRKPALNSRYWLGKSVGNTSLKIACVELGDKIPDMTGFGDSDVQALVRSQSLVTLHRSRVLGDQIGDYPSMAQLADPDSDLSVHWRRQAFNTALVEVYEQAVEEIPLAP